MLRIPSLRSAAILSFEDQSTSISSRCTVDKTVAEDQEVHPDMPDPTTAVHDLAADHPGKDDVNLSPHPGLRPTKPSLKTSGRFLHTGSLPQTCWITTQCMACHSLVELSVPALPGHWEYDNLPVHEIRLIQVLQDSSYDWCLRQIAAGKNCYLEMFRSRQEAFFSTALH